MRREIKNSLLSQLASVLLFGSFCCTKSCTRVRASYESSTAVNSHSHQEKQRKKKHQQEPPPKFSSTEEVGGRRPGAFDVKRTEANLRSPCTYSNSTMRTNDNRHPFQGSAEEAPGGSPVPFAKGASRGAATDSYGKGAALSLCWNMPL